jgi:nucleoid DNA-binding protein
MSGQKFNKKWFIKEVADKANFTQSDVELIWKTVEDVIQNIVANHDELHLAPLFSLMVRARKGRRVNNIKTGELYESEDSFGVVYKAGVGMKKIAKDNANSVDEIDESLQPRLF